MATWQDGPEYAPVERPDSFLPSPAEPLVVAVVPPPPPAAPAEQPRFDPPQTPTPDLAALVSDTGPSRDPGQAFAVASVALMAAETLPSSRSPLEPFGPPGPSLQGYLPTRSVVAPTAQINPPAFPEPGTPGWFAPPPPPPPAPVRTVTIGQIFTAATPGVIIPLAVGAMFSWVSFLMFAVAFSLSARIAYRRKAIQRSFLVSSLLIAAVAVLELLDYGFYADVLVESLSSTALLVCWVLPVVILVIVASALRSGERPDRSS